MTAAAKHTKKGDTLRLHQRMHHSVKRQYDKRMPHKRHHRIIIWVVFCTLATVIAMQLLYPPNRALPFASLQQEQVGFATEEGIAFRLQQLFKSMSVRLVVDEDTVVEANLADIGGELNVSDVIESLDEYPFEQRFIPFSIIWYRHSVDTVQITYNQAILDSFAAQTSKKLTVAPQNARLAIEDGELVATDDVAGRSVTADDINKAIAQHAYTLGEASVITLDPTEQPADTTARDLSAVRQEAESVLARTVQIVVDDEVVEPTQAQRADWIELVQGEDVAVALQFDADALKKYLQSLNKKVGVSAGVTTVYLTDGEQTRVSRGADGRAIHDAPLIEQVEAWMMRLEGEPVLTAEFRVLKPSTRYERSYTSSQTGLQAYVNDASHAQNATIVVQQTNGAKWKAQAGGSASMPSASTYKLYIAWILFTKMDQGAIAWGDAMRDTTVSGCFDRMIVVSANACAEQWIGEFGRANINTFLYSHGYSRGTSFTLPGATQTTAGDLAKFMVGLDNGSVIDGVQRYRLLRGLSTHLYRQGVPAGSSGQVWNKVGFLWDYVHDAAIVHHPKGNYVIIVMTKGRSYATIAQITRQIERIMYN